jgi:type IV pilus assembly protein PilW
LPGPNDVTIDNNLGCRVGDVAMIVNGTDCKMTIVTGPTDIAFPPVASAPPNTTTVSLFSTAGAIVNANISCLGGWNVTTFQLNPKYLNPLFPADPLYSQAFLQKSGSPSVRDIVNIQAQYGISTIASSNQVNQWVDATGIWAAPTVANRNRIKAVHIAVVARNGLLEKDVVTLPCTTNQGTINNGPCAWDDTNLDAAPAIDLSNDPNWQNYRYRVFETIVPLRNMIWSKDTL